MLRFLKKVVLLLLIKTRQTIKTLPRSDKIQLIYPSLSIPFVAKKVGVAEDNYTNTVPGF